MLNINPFILFCFFLSGMTSLIYEVVWTRYLTSVFGSSNYSISTVLTAFMAGLAAGSLLAAKASKKFSFSPIALYIVLEALIGFFALFSPELFSLLKKFSLSLLPAESYLDASAGLWIKFTLSSLLLAVPTILMGATFPILSLYAAENKVDINRAVGGLYAVNTIGAVFGTFLAGFILLHTIGVDNSVRAAALVNLAIGASLWVMNKKGERGQGAGGREQKKEGGRLKAEGGGQKAEGGRRKAGGRSQSSIVNCQLEDCQGAGDREGLKGMATSFPRILLALFALSGFLSLGYEVLWTRLLTQVVGSSTYAFSIILIAFLFGIAVGSWVLSRWTSQDAVSPGTFGWLLAGIGLFSYLLVPMMSSLPQIMLKAFQWFPDSFTGILVFQFFLVSAIVFPSTMLMGATMPVVISLLRAYKAGIPDCVGTAYFFNTIGAIFGSFLMGFVLIPKVGTLFSLKAAITLNLVLGAGFLYFYGRAVPPASRPSPFAFRRFRFSHAIPLLVLVPLWSQTWKEGMLDVCVSIYGPELASKNEKTTLGDQVFHAEGINASISVRQAYDRVSLHINGKADASNGRDMATQLLLGLLPHLARPGEEDALVIGLGSGVTAMVLADALPARKVWVAEIEPTVVEASRFFAVENHSLLEKKNVRFVLNDARNVLSNSGKKFGLITSEPSNPWIMGISNLFTREFYEMVRGNLKEDGVFVQWFHLYGMDLQNYKMVLKTLSAVFPSIQLWESGFGDMLFVCAKGAVRWDLSHLHYMERGAPGVFKDLRQALFIEKPEDLWAYFNGAYTAKAFNFPGVSENTDQLPLLEFKAPLSLYKDTLPENRKFSMDLFQSASNQEDVGFPGLRIADCGRGILENKSEIRNPKSQICRMAGIIRTKALRLINHELFTEAGELLASYPREWKELDLPRAKLALKNAEPSKAVALLKKYLGGDGVQNEELLLGEAAAANGDFSLAMQALEGLGALALEGMKDDEIERLAALWQSVGAVDKAYAILKERTAKSSGYRLLFLMGKIMGSRQDFTAAERHLRESLAANPHSGSTVLLLGNALWAQGRKEEAKVLYERYQENWEGSDKVAARLKE
ncbi:MAG: fused MFS/spermidine synthase [Nitrospinae bacterium]|nr:fused MFS/spermidine synthase [Nitrospinota bacterium]